MKVGEILRSVADEIDQLNATEKMSIPVKVDNVDAAASTTMVSPLQQKHELLKQAGGVANNVDAFEEPDDSELDNIKKLAGIDLIDLIAQDENEAE